jgi:hypothetical protein
MQFMTALEAHSHFDSRAVWSFREAEPNKSRIVSMCMLAVRDNVMPAPTMDLPSPSARASIAGGEFVDQGSLRYEGENSCYQCMVQRRPVRKCWWEMVSVTTNLEALQRLKDLAGEKGIKKSGSLRNLGGVARRDIEEYWDWRMCWEEKAFV